MVSTALSPSAVAPPSVGGDASTGSRPPANSSADRPSEHAVAAPNAVAIA